MIIDRLCLWSLTGRRPLAVGSFGVVQYELLVTICGDQDVSQCVACQLLWLGAPRGTQGPGSYLIGLNCLANFRYSPKGGLAPRARSDALCGRLAYSDCECGQYRPRNLSEIKHVTTLPLGLICL